MFSFCAFLGLSLVSEWHRLSGWLKTLSCLGPAGQSQRTLWRALVPSIHDRDTQLRSRENTKPVKFRQGISAGPGHRAPALPTPLDAQPITLPTLETHSSKTWLLFGHERNTLDSWWMACAWRSFSGIRAGLGPPHPLLLEVSPSLRRQGCGPCLVNQQLSPSLSCCSDPFWKNEAS